jgi:DNA replication licensing factor MCM6
VREAYTLLRQSIIHVEQDDIDFDEEELEGERDREAPRRASSAAVDDSGDVEMSGLDDSTQLDGPNGHINGVAHSPSSHAASPAPGTPTPAASAAPQPKRRMVITHDKYMTLQSLVVLHLAQVERETGKGIDRDELIDWYLELKESEIQDVEELEYEKELISKMLRKLVKVGRLLPQGKTLDADSISIRTTTSLRSRATFKSHFPCPWTKVRKSLPP